MERFLSWLARMTAVLALGAVLVMLQLTTRPDLTPSAPVPNSAIKSAGDSATQLEARRVISPSAQLQISRAISVPYRYSAMLVGNKGDR